MTIQIRDIETLIEAIDSARLVFVYGKATGVHVRVTKKEAKSRLSQWQIVDDWDNNNCRLDDEGDLVIEI